MRAKKCACAHFVGTRRSEPCRIATGETGSRKFSERKLFVTESHRSLPIKISIVVWCMCHGIFDCMEGYKPPAEKVSGQKSLDNFETTTPNPNSIGELLGFKEGVPTNPDKVYRSVEGREAIDDLFEFGSVRNAFSAGVKEKRKWNERVFWSRGVTGKCHTVSLGRYVIEAPYTSASIGPVKSEDVIAIFTKNESDEIIDILPEYLSKKYSI